MSSKRRRLLILMMTLVFALGVQSVAYAGDEGSEKPDATESDAGAEEPVDDSEEADPVTLTDVTSTLPVLGSGLTISVTIGEDGTVTEVTLDPSGDETVVREGDQGVKFLLGDGETKVSVRGGPLGVVTRVKAASLEDVSGPGSLSADVFGTGIITIPYTVGADADGAPTVTLGDIVVPADVTFEVREADGHENGDAVFVRLSSGDQTAFVWIKVRVRELDNGTVGAVVSTGIRTVNRGDRVRPDDRERPEERDVSERDGDSDRRGQSGQSGDRDHGDRDGGDRDRGERDGGGRADAGGRRGG